MEHKANMTCQYTTVHFITHHSSLIPFLLLLSPPAPAPITLCLPLSLSPRLPASLYSLLLCLLLVFCFTALFCHHIPAPASPPLLFAASFQQDTNRWEKHFLNLVSLDMAFSICLRLLNDLNDWDWDTVHSASLIWTFFSDISRIIWKQNITVNFSFIKISFQVTFCSKPVLLWFKSEAFFAITNKYIFKSHVSLFWQRQCSKPSTYEKGDVLISFVSHVQTDIISGTSIAELKKFKFLNCQARLKVTSSSRSSRSSSLVNEIARSSCKPIQLSTATEPACPLGESFLCQIV